MTDDTERRIVDRRTVLGTLGAGAIAAVGGCSTRADAAGTTLRVGTIQPPVTLDPITARSVGSAQAIGKVFDGLYAYDAAARVRPQIAAGPPTPDGSGAIRVEVADGARFQNGAPVTATDVKYSVEAPLAEDTAAKAAVSPVESVEVVDDRTVRFVLAHPDPVLDEALTRPIVPKAVRNGDEEAFAEDPVGAGPFEVESFREEKTVTLARWPEYRGDPAPAIDRLSIVSIESPLTAMMSLRTGRTDVVEPVSARLRERMRDVTGASVAARESYRSYYFGFNLNEGPTTDRTVREAIGHCIDLDDAVEAFVAPLGRRQYGPVPPLVADDWAFPRGRWRSLTPDKDLARAGRLFAEAGTRGRQLPILTSPDPRWTEFAERLARGLRDAGQPALVKSVPWKRYLDRSVSGSARDYAVFVGEVAGTPDPDSFLYPVVHENVEGLTNGVFYREESVMNALLSARRTVDRKRRTALYTSAIERLLRERVLLPICSVENSFAHARSVRGFRVAPIARLNPRVVGPDGALTIEGKG
ncbi:MAG: ABC transporter substrate-binding protein [Haloferacaceae archaeon]